MPGLCAPVRTTPDFLSLVMNCAVLDTPVRVSLSGRQRGLWRGQHKRHVGARLRCGRTGLFQGLALQHVARACASASLYVLHNRASCISPEINAGQREWGAGCLCVEPRIRR